MTTYLLTYRLGIELGIATMLGSQIPLGIDNTLETSLVELSLIAWECW